MDIFDTFYYKGIPLLMTSLKMAYRGRNM